MNHWHYQVMKEKDEAGNTFYGIHEYFPLEEGNLWTEDPVRVTGESIEDLKESLLCMLHDIEKHGVKDYE